MNRLRFNDRLAAAPAEDGQGTLSIPKLTKDNAMPGTLYRIERIQAAPISAQACWEFFSDPRNLATITPPALGYRLLESRYEPIFPGQLLECQVSPLWGIPLRWITEITHVVPPALFVDEQRFGPYRFWHHTHRFRPIDQGTEIVDTVCYMLPFGPIGSLMNRFLVAKQLKAIFDYRQEALETRFGSLPQNHSTEAQQQHPHWDHLHEPLPHSFHEIE